MENSYINPTPQQDLLSDLTIDLRQATKGKRLANYLIDVVIYYVFVFLIAAALAVFGTPGIFNLTHNKFLDLILALVYYGTFMGIYEGICKGKTLGKLATRTRAVNEDGSTISFKTAFLRGLSRAVPFEAFSALGDPSYPWHDSWTKTYVIDETSSTLS